MLLTVIFHWMYKMKFTAAIKILLLFMAGLFIGFLFEKWAACQSNQKSYFRWHTIVFKMSLLTSPCLMPAILAFQLDGYLSNVVYVASLCTFVRFETMIWPSRRLWEGMKIIWAPIKTPAWEARPKQRGGISGIFQRMTSCMLSETKTGGDDLPATDNDYKWLPAEFRNRFSFGNVCWQKPGSHWMCGRAGLGFSSQEHNELMLRKVFHLAVVPHPLFRLNLLMLTLMWQFVLNRVWQIVRCCLWVARDNNREAAVLKDFIITGKR